MKDDIEAMRIEANRIGQKASEGARAGKAPRKSSSTSSFRGI